MSTALEEDDLGFDDAVLGRGLPAEVEALIAQAGRVRHIPHEAEALLLQARAMAPDHPATLIALYRFHFYGHRLREARVVAEEALSAARAALGPGFGTTPITEHQARFDAATRFFLFTLKGYAYLSLRLGEFDVGRTAINELRQLDPDDRVGGSVLAQVLQRMGRDEDDDDTPAVRTPRGWGPVETTGASA